MSKQIRADKYHHKLQNYEKHERKGNKHQASLNRPPQNPESTKMEKKSKIEALDLEIDFPIKTNHKTEPKLQYQPSEKSIKYINYCDVVKNIERAHKSTQTDPESVKNDQCEEGKEEEVCNEEITGKTELTTAINEELRAWVKNL